MRLVDTHCHIHEADYRLDRVDVLERARDADVTKLICVGTSTQSSQEAIRFSREHDAGVYASIGIHPHEAETDTADIESLIDEDTRLKIVAVGEIGLDYFYTHSTREAQIPLLEKQLQVAQDYDLPVIFHVREAFEDFWPILGNFKRIRGVLHSFTDTATMLETALERGLYIGVNGISTFTKDPAQQAMFASIPLENLLLETDSPYLTPVPRRGTVNEPAFVSYVAQFHANVRGISLDLIGDATTTNALNLFSIGN